MKKVQVVNENVGLSALSGFVKAESNFNCFPCYIVEVKRKHLFLLKRFDIEQNHLIFLFYEV